LSTPINFIFSGNYYIFFDSAKTVKQVEVFNYQATHGYEITAKGWLKQFAGFSGNDTLEIKGVDRLLRRFTAILIKIGFCLLMYKRL